MGKEKDGQPAEEKQKKSRRPKLNLGRHFNFGNQGDYASIYAVLAGKTSPKPPDKNDLYVKALLGNVGSVSEYDQVGVRTVPVVGVTRPEHLKDEIENGQLGEVIGELHDAGKHTGVMSTINQATIFVARHPIALGVLGGVAAVATGITVYAVKQYRNPPEEKQKK